MVNRRGCPVRAPTRMGGVEGAPESLRSPRGPYTLSRPVAVAHIGRRADRLHICTPRFFPISRPCPLTKRSCMHSAVREACATVVTPTTSHRLWGPKRPAGPSSDNSLRTTSRQIDRASGTRLESQRVEERAIPAAEPRVPLRRRSGRPSVPVLSRRFREAAPGQRWRRRAAKRGRHGDHRRPAQRLPRIHVADAPGVRAGAQRIRRSGSRGPRGGDARVRARRPGAALALSERRSAGSTCRDSSGAH